MSAVSNRKSRILDLPIAQFVAIIVLTISVFLIIDFGRRAAASYRIHQEKERLLAQLAEAEKHRAELEARLAFVATDEYVAQVARQQLKWSLPDETVIVIMATPEPSSLAPPQDPSPFSGPADTPFEAWWLLLLGPLPSP